MSYYALASCDGLFDFMVHIAHVLHMLLLIIVWYL